MQSGKQFRNVVIQGALGLALAAGVMLVPAQTFAQKLSTDAPQLSVAIEPQADTATRGDGVDTYKLVVVNRTGGSAEDIVLNVPFQAGYSLSEASLSQNDAWVARSGDGLAQIQVEQMRGIGDRLEATLRFVGPSDAGSNALTSRVSASWNANDEKYSGASNLPGATNVALTATPTAPTRIAFSGGAFATNEPVNFWYTGANGVSIPLVVEDGVLIQKPAKSQFDDGERKLGAALAADAQGSVSVSASIAGLPAGSYTLAARGGWSGVTASAPFTVK